VTLPFIAEIRIVSFNYPPKGWAFCSGQLLPINQNQALFSLLGTTFGGDGRVNFALPDLRSRAPMHWGAATGLTPRNLGEPQGSAAVTLTADQIPAHTHVAQATEREASTRDPAGALLAASTEDAYAAPGALVPMAALPPVGGSQPHENRQPYLALHFVIALQGIFPSQS
jgi:microcystin-dependent protein